MSKSSKLAATMDAEQAQFAADVLESIRKLSGANLLAYTRQKRFRRGVLDAPWLA